MWRHNAGIWRDYDLQVDLRPAGKARLDPRIPFQSDPSSSDCQGSGCCFFKDMEETWCCFSKDTAETLGSFDENRNNSVMFWRDSLKISIIIVNELKRKRTHIGFKNCAENLTLSWMCRRFYTEVDRICPFYSFGDSSTMTTWGRNVSLFGWNGDLFA